MIFDAAWDDFPAEGGVGGLKPADERGIEGGAERIDIVDKEGAKLRARGEEAGERAVFEEVRNLDPVADGVEALTGEVVGVVGALADGAGPVGEGGADAVAHFLFLFVEFLLRGFFPSEDEVADGGDEAEADGAAG